MIVHSYNPFIYRWRGRVSLIPGSNTVSDAIVKDMKKDDRFLDLVEKGKFRFLKVEYEGDKPKSADSETEGTKQDALEQILAMKATDGVKAVKDSGDIELLRMVSDSDDAKATVVTAADKQIARLEEDREEKEKDEE